LLAVQVPSLNGRSGLLIQCSDFRLLGIKPEISMCYFVEQTTSGRHCCPFLAMFYGGVLLTTIFSNGAYPDFYEVAEHAWLEV